MDQTLTPEAIVDAAPEKPKGKERDALLERARDRRAYADSRDRDNREAQAADTRFVYKAGAQWDDNIVARRKAWGDPCLEFPQLKQFINQVVNDARQNRPGIRIHAASGDASVEVAQIIQGMIRVIEYDSNAEAVYDSAYQNAVIGGRGYYRITAEYLDSESFDQSLRMSRLPDSNAVRIDPDFTQPDASDINWAFIEEAIPKAEFYRRWPKAQPLSYDDGYRNWWTDEDHVIICDYYERVRTSRTLCALKDGSVIFKDDLKKLLEQGGVEGDIPAGVIVRERETEDIEVKWYTIAGGEQILETHFWPGTIIPVVCVMGDEVMVDGKRMFQGLIAQAKSSQALFNYGMTQQAIHLALTPRAPYIAAYGQIEEFKEMWEQANNRNYSVLTYNPVTVEGQVAPPPQRQAPASPDAGWINWTQQMTMLMKATIGMYEANLGMRGNEVSGRAITAREKQGDTATYHYADNLSRAIALGGRIILECIPYYYDQQRIVHILGDDDKREEVTVNEQVPQKVDPETGAITAITQNDIRVGRYAVTVASGPSYQTRRQEAAELMMQLVQADPQLLQVAGDIIIRAQEVPQAEELAERVQAVLPPPIQQLIAAKKQRKDPMLAQMTQQMQQMQQQMQQAQQQIQDLQHKLEQEKADKSASIAASQARQRVAEAQMAGLGQGTGTNQNDVQVAGIEHQTQLVKLEQDKYKDVSKQIVDISQQQKQMFELLKTLIQNKSPDPATVARDTDASEAAVGDIYNGPDGDEGQGMPPISQGPMNG